MVFGVNVLDLDFWVQIDSIEQPVKGNSVGPGNMSHCGTSALIIILITASLSSEKHRALHQNEKTSRSTKHNQHYSIQSVVLDWSLGLILGVLV